MAARAGGGGRVGSVVLLLAAAVVLLRPWEQGLLPTAPEPREAHGYVVRAVDGDTIEARIDGTLEDIRYIGVDTPETVKPGTPVQCFGHRASDFNRRLAEGERARLVFGVERRDVYGRLLAYVYIGHSFVNAELVRRGFARTLAIPPNTRYRVLFGHLEQHAALLGRGLWGACEP
jgi:micrococcal nuclease